MSSRFKKFLVKEIYNHCKEKISFASEDQIALALKSSSLGRMTINSPLRFKDSKRKKDEIVEFDVPVVTLVPGVVDKVSVTKEGGRKQITFESNPQQVMKDILETDPKELSFLKERKKIVIEHSSPTVSKPFYYGHVRSMLLGNTIANIKEKLGENVVRLNFLGDWGNELNLVKLGVELEGLSEESLVDNPVELLFQAYVRGNDEFENDPNKISETKNLKEFEDKVQGWIVNYLKKTYDRVGVNFDEYHWESNYNQESNVIKAIKGKGLFLTDEQNRICAKVKDKTIPLIKNDGSTLYLARDLNAVFDRLKYNFDEMYYVVEDKQNDHFQRLIALCQELGVDKAGNIHHVQFAKVQGLTTGTSSVDFIKNVFDEARNLMMNKGEEKTVGKAVTDEETAEIVGQSAVVVSLLKQKRQIPCEFDWAKAFLFRGDTGVRIQHTHALLHNLLKTNHEKIPLECDPKYLQEPAITKLIFFISKYEEKLLESDIKFDPSIIVNYLIKLAILTSEAHHSLKINNKVDERTAGQRLLLFQCSKRVLKDGLRILGLKPLEKL